jgi:transcription elongation GreA/GreB family factor
MNKEKVLTLIKKQLDEKYVVAKAAVKEAYSSATDGENIAENKYDTTGLEASYLVQGQARRLEELEMSISAFRQMKTEESTKVYLGSLIKVEENKKESFLFIGPQAGGLKVAFEDTEVLVITPYSPIGKILCGKSQGDEADVIVGRKTKSYRIVKIY